MGNVVFDASSLVSALIKQGSVPERALLCALAYYRVCMSSAVADEYLRVLGRPKFRRYFTDERIRLLTSLLTEPTAWFEPTVGVTDCRDAKDNRYLELALAASAVAIVSSDLDLLVLSPWRGVPIVPPAEFLQRFPG